MWAIFNSFLYVYQGVSHDIPMIQAFLGEMHPSRVCATPSKAGQGRTAASAGDPCDGGGESSMIVFSYGKLYDGDSTGSFMKLWETLGNRHLVGI